MPVKKGENKKKGGNAGDVWPGDRIAGPVTSMPSGSFESDKGIPANMQYAATAASLAAVNQYEGGARSSKRKSDVERHRTMTLANAKLEHKKIQDVVNALVKLSVAYEPAKPRKVTFAEKSEFKTKDGYEVVKYTKKEIDLNKVPSSGGRRKKKPVKRK